MLSIIESIILSLQLSLSMKSKDPSYVITRLFCNSILSSAVESRWFEMFKDWQVMYTMQKTIKIIRLLCTFHISLIQTMYLGI